MRFARWLALVSATVRNAATGHARGFARLAVEAVGRGARADQRGVGLVVRRRDPGGDQKNEIRERPRRGLSWPLRLLLMASLAVPLLLLGIAAWQNYHLVQRQAEERVMIEAGQLHEQALNTLKTYVIVLAWVDARTRGLD